MKSETWDMGAFGAGVALGGGGEARVEHEGNH